MSDSTFDIRNEIQNLNEAELKFLTEHFRHPVVIKYLRNRVLHLVLENALQQPDHTLSDAAHRVKDAYNRAYICAYNDLLSDIPKITS